MKSLICLVLVGVVSCTSLLKNPPPNADVKYIYENNKLVEVKIDYINDLRPIVKSASLPVPTVRKVVSIAAPAAPLPAVNKAGATKTYYKVDDCQLERVKPTHVRYSVLPEAPAAHVVKSAPAPASPIFKSAPIPVATAAAPAPLRITGPQVVLRQAPAPTARSVIITGPRVIFKQAPAPIARSVIITGPQVIYKRGPAPVPVAAPAPVVMVRSLPNAPIPASPLIKTFWKQDDGELEKISPTHVSYSLVKSAPVPAPVPVVAPIHVVPVAAPAPVVYSLPKPAPMTSEEESMENED